MKLLTTSILMIFLFNANAQWSLVWADEFDGTALDSDKWGYETGGNGWGNNESQFYTNSGNLTVANGELTVTAKVEQIGNNPYTSAKITTENKMSLRYGKIEARLKAPLGQGLWPAFWMLGTNIHTVSWPYCGEIDIFEHINTSADIHGTMHWENGGHVYYGGSATTTPENYHTYAIEWDSAQINWFLDGVQYHSANILNGVNGTSEFHEPFYLILNLAVGGNWPGYPDATTPFPSSLKVDYVRVYKKSYELSIEDESNQNTFSFYPNPATNEMTCDLLQSAYLNIVDLQGSSVLAQDLEKGLNAIDISKLPSGMYICKITNEDGSQAFEKLIKA